jgi:hypothetical protein
VADVLRIRLLAPAGTVFTMLRGATDCTQQVRGVAAKATFTGTVPRPPTAPTRGVTFAPHHMGPAPKRTSPPTAAMERPRAEKYDESVAKLTITEREIVKQHLRAHEQPEFAAEYHTPNGVIAYQLMEGPAPDGHDLAMPTRPGPTTYKAAMEDANWRGWLSDFISEIDGQIEVGCFHWAVAPVGFKLLSPVCVFTRRLHFRARQVQGGRRRLEGQAWGIR